MIKYKSSNSSSKLSNRKLNYRSAFKEEVIEIIFITHKNDFVVKALILNKRV